MKPNRKSVATLLRDADVLLNEHDSLGAAARYKEAADRGSAEGAFWLGMMYEYNN